MVLQELDSIVSSQNVPEGQRSRCRQFLAEALLRTGQSEQGIEILEEMSRLKRVQYAKKARSKSKALASIAFRYLDASMFVEAEPYLRESLDLLQANAKADHWRQFVMQSVLGAALAEQSKYEEAEPLLLAGARRLLEDRVKPPFAAPREIANAVRRNIRFYELTEQSKKADEWRGIADQHGFRQRIAE